MCFPSSLEALPQPKFKFKEESETSYVILENKVGDKRDEQQ